IIGIQAVAHAMDRLDVPGTGRLWLNLLAQAVNVDRKGRGVGPSLEEGLNQDTTGHRLTRPFQEDLQQPELGGGQEDLLAVHPGPSGAGIDSERAPVEGGRVAPLT